MMSRAWRVAAYDERSVRMLSESLELSLLTASVLVARGLGEVHQAQRWMQEGMGNGYDPLLLPDMGEAVERLHRAIRRKEPICCYGDYDVDGMSATSLCLVGLRHLGADVRCYIPDRRTEGYGLNGPAIHRLAQEGVKVLVTADCGTTSHQEVELAHREGIDVIVVDHHQLRGPSPSVHACVNPHRPGSQYPFPDLCSAGLVYKMMMAYRQTYGDGGWNPESLLELVALATIADMVPLVDENRRMVRQGLAQLSASDRCGIRALLQRLGVTGSCTEQIVAFQVAPMLNAAGRLAHAALGVDLLTTDSPDAAKGLTDRLDELNRRRRSLERDMVQEAVAMLESAILPEAIVVGGHSWHIGVVGIVASRLVERYDRPAVVMAFDDQGIGRGSVRSAGGVDICKILVQCSDLLITFGGHPSAAGLTLHEKNLGPFRERFSHLVAVAKMEGGTPWAADLEVDAPVRLNQITRSLMQELQLVAPFGVGNPEPTFLAEGVRVLECQKIGEDHLRLTLRQKGSVPFRSMGFRLAGRREVNDGGPEDLDVVFVPELHRWKGLEQIQLRLLDWRIHQRG